MQTDPDPALAAAVAERIGAAPPDWKPMRGGRTNRLWRIFGPAGDLVVKHYALGAETPLFPNDAGAEYRVLSALAPKGLAPDPLCRLSGTYGEALVYRFLDGPTWSGEAGSVARLLHRVHQQTPPEGLRALASGAQALKRQTAELLDLCPEPATAELRRLLADLNRCPDVPALAAPSLIHGDPVVANVVETATGPVLIDWQCPAIGDPCEDLAIFLSPFMQRRYLGHLLSAEENKAFINAYPETQVTDRYRQLAPIFHLRMAGYAIWCMATGRDAGPEDLERESAAALAAA